MKLYICTYVFLFLQKYTRFSQTILIRRLYFLRISNLNLLETDFEENASVALLRIL